MGDEHHRLVDLAAEAHHLVLHVAADQRVERRERLVEEHDRRVGGERPGESDPLLLTAAQLVRLVGAHPAESDQLERLLGRRPPLRLVDAAQLEPEGDVVDQRAVRQQPEVLEHHRDLVAADLEQLRRGRRR